MGKPASYKYLESLAFQRCLLSGLSFNRVPLNLADLRLIQEDLQHGINVGVARVKKALGCEKEEIAKAFCKDSRAIAFLRINGVRESSLSTEEQENAAKTGFSRAEKLLRECGFSDGARRASAPLIKLEAPFPSPNKGLVNIFTKIPLSPFDPTKKR